MTITAYLYPMHSSERSGFTRVKWGKYVFGAMDLHQRKTGRIAFPGADLNVRSCTPAFYHPGKQPCSLSSRQLQDALVPIQHSSYSTQVFSVEQGPPPPPLHPHETRNHPQDIEYVTMPVYKARKKEPQQHFNPSELDEKPPPENNLDLRTIRMPEGHPCFCLQSQTPIHQEQPKIMAFQPPPRSPRREPAARALVSQFNSHYSAYAEKDMEGRGDDSLYYSKNLMMNFPNRRAPSEIQIPIPFQWVELNPNKQNQKPVMKPIPEKVETNSFQRYPEYEMFPDKPQHVAAEEAFKQRQAQQENDVGDSSSKKLQNDSSFNKHNKSSYKISNKKSFRDGSRSSRDGYSKKKNGGNQSDGTHQDSYMSPLNFSTTSQSSIDSPSNYNTKGRNLKAVKCSCSEENGHFSAKKSRRCKRSPKARSSVGNQTDFLKSPFEEKLLFRETILFGCDKIGKWARELPMVSEIADMGDSIREKTTQSRAQNICSAFGSEIEIQVIVTEYLKVFLDVADSWLEARNCFGLTDNCKRKACQLNSPEISQNYLEWQHASRRLLGNIINGVGGVLAPKNTNILPSEIEVSNYAPPNLPFPVTINDSKVECRLTRSTSNLPKDQKRAFPRRQKWTMSDTASTTSQCSSGLRPTSHSGDEFSIAKYYQNQDDFPATTQPIKISDIPQHKITLLSQIEPPCLRKSEKSCPSVDISPWFAGKNNEGANRCISSEDGRNVTKDNPTGFPMPPSAKPSNVQKSQSVTTVYPPNEGSQDSLNEVQQKIYMKPGSYIVPKKKLTNAKKRTNVQKAKESCCGETEVPKGFVIPFVNAAPFVPPPGRGLQSSNIKIVKKIAGASDNVVDLTFKGEERKKNENLEDKKKQGVN